MDLFLNIGLYHFLATSIFLFAIGLFGAIFSNNLIKTLISLEFLFCGVILNLASFAVYCDDSKYKGISLIFVITVIVSVLIAAGLITAMNISKYKESLNVENLNNLKG